MTRPLIWIIDEEWANYDIEEKIILSYFPDAMIKYSTYDYAQDLKSFGRQADLILAQVYAEIPGEVIEQLKFCRGIALFGGGYDRIDIAAAKRCDIPVTIVKGYCVDDIADYVLTSMLYFNKPLISYYSKIKEHPWGLPAVTTMQKRIQDQTLLIVGFGRIGRRVAAKACTLGMRVLCSDPQLTKANTAGTMIESVDLETGLQQADYVSIHCNLMPSTTHLIDMSKLALMRPSSVLINTSRGLVVDERALIEAVKCHEIRGAVLDVVTNEPPQFEDPIYHTENIIVTPHISYVSEESIGELKRRATENALSMYKGIVPEDVINM